MRPPPDIVRFPGFRLPSTDFNAVRDDTQIAYLFYEQDLATAHSIAAGTQVQLPLKGNSIYIDQNSDVGSATIVFHDQSLTAKPGKVFVQPGFNADIPFDVITIENLAQPGKVLRIFYGVDIDFKPGIAGVVTIPGQVSVADVGLAPGTQFISNAAITGGTPLNVLAAASNLLGVRIHDAEVCSWNVTTFNYVTLLAKATAPTTAIDGMVICTANNFLHDGAAFCQTGRILKPLKIAAGLRMDYFTTTTDTLTNAPRKVLYDIL